MVQWGPTGRRAGVAALSVARAGATRGKSVVSALNSGAAEPVGLLVRVFRLCTPREPMPTPYKGIESPPHLRRTMHTLCNNMDPADAHVKRHIGLNLLWRDARIVAFASIRPEASDACGQ